jgi:hypothetical protein
MYDMFFLRIISENQGILAHTRHITKFVFFSTSTVILKINFESGISRGEGGGLINFVFLSRYVKVDRV